MIPVWILTTIFAAARAFYFSLVEAFALWFLANSFCAAFCEGVVVGYWTSFFVLFIVNYIISRRKVTYLFD